MKKVLIPLSFAIVVTSCSNPGKAEEFDRKNLYLAEFFYDGGFYGRALMHAGRIKKSSPQYPQAREWVRRIEVETEGPEPEEADFSSADGSW